MSSPTELDNSHATNQDVTSSSTHNHTRRVHFPSDESQLRVISIAPEPLANQPLLSLGVILQRYRGACQRLQIRPLNSLLDQLNTMDDDRRSFDDRLICFKITNEKLDLKQMDAIEEILSRCRFLRLDFDSSINDDSTLIQFFDVIEYYESCTHLNLSNHRSMSPQGYQALTRYLRRTRFLERLDMNLVRFDDMTMFSFGRALRLASTLYELHVESCQLNGKILQKFIQNLRACPSLRELYLCDNRLQVQDSLLINELIRSCGQFLRLLDLRSNALHDNGMSHIASQLSQYDEHHAQQNTISNISFQSNQLTQQGVAFLAKCLLHNRTIRSLNLSHNNLTNEGLFLLRDALLTNRTINELILRNCRLTDQAAIALAEFIAESSTIQYIDLRENNIQASGICGIAIAIKTNQSLLKLDFDPIVTELINSRSSSTNNIDRAASNTSLLSLSNLRRMTIGVGSFSGSTSFNMNSADNTQELLEQKTKWMNDITGICQRNTLIYEEQLRKQHDQPTQVNPAIALETKTTDGTDQQESTIISPHDIVLEEPMIEPEKLEKMIPLATTSNEHLVPSIENNSEDVLNSPEEISKPIEAPMDASELMSANENHVLEQSLDNSTSTDNPVELPPDISIIDNNQLGQSNVDTTEFLSNGNNHEELEPITMETNVILPMPSSSLSDVMDDDKPNGDNDENEENKRKIRHSDSLHLLRKKVQNDADNSSEDESPMSVLMEELQ